MVSFALLVHFKSLDSRNTKTKRHGREEIRKMRKLKRILCGLCMLLLILSVGQMNSHIQINAKSNKAYTIKTKKVKYKDKKGNVRGIISYEYPQLKGNTKAIKKINKRIRKQRDTFFTSKQAKYLKLYLTDENWHNEQYFYKRKCKIRYNKGNIFSFTEAETFFAGFSSHTYYYGYNYNLKTGKTLTYKNAISGNARKKIIKATKKVLKDEAINYKKGCKELNEKKHFEFYISPGKVYICYQPFEIGRCGQPGMVAVKGKYK